MVLPVGCSRCGDTRLRREPAARQRASCRSRLRPRAVVPQLALLTAFHRRGRDFWIWRRRRNSCAGDRDRGERGARAGRAGSGAGDALDGVVGAARGPVIALRADLKVVMAVQPVDFRKSVHTLSAVVSEALQANPYCGDVLVFRYKRMDRVKLLAWDGSGMVLVTKWLEQGRFSWPPIRDGVVHLSATQLAMLLDALDWMRVSPKPVRQPALVG